MSIYNVNIEYDTCCSAISLDQWENLMTGAKKANGSKIRKLIKLQLPELYESLALDFRNPYEASSQRTATHFIYVSSAIEYFLRIV